MLESLFESVLKMSLIGSYSILVVLLARIFLKKCGRKFAYYLWLIVFFNLAVPISLEGRFSLIPRQVAEITRPGYEAEKPMQVQHPDGDWFYISENASDTTDFGENTDAAGSSVLIGTAKVHGSAAFRGEGFLGSRTSLAVFAVIWALGLAVICGYNLAQLIYWTPRLSRKNWIRWDEKKRVAEVRGLAAPFLWGVFRPVVCLPPGLEKDELRYIAAHELCHRRRKDPLIKAVCFMIAAVHWFNPLVWAAWALFCRDMEISCDEEVLDRSRQNIQKQYAASLLKYAARQNGYLMTPLTFGEPSVKARIRNVLGFRKRHMVLAVIAGICVFLVVLGLAVRPERESEAEELEFYISEDNETPGIYVFEKETGESRLSAEGEYEWLWEDDSYLYACRREKDGLYVDSLRKTDGFVEENLIQNAVAAERIFSFYADEDHILYSAGQVEGSMGNFVGAFYSYDRKNDTVIEAKLTDSSEFFVADGKVYYQKYWTGGEGDNELYRTDFAFETEEQVGAGMRFLGWDEERNRLLLAEKAEDTEQQMLLIAWNLENDEEMQLFDTDNLQWEMELYDYFYFTDLQFAVKEFPDTFQVIVEQWGYRGDNGWRDSRIRTAKLRIKADGSGYEVVSDSAEESVAAGNGSDAAGETAEVFRPSKEAVEAAREQALSGMTQEAAARLKENIKVANQTMEHAHLNDNLFKKLSDPENLYWNYVDQKGDIQIGVTADGEAVMAYNRFDADNFVELMEDMKKDVRNKELISCIDQLILNMQTAKETHDVSYVEAIYQQLHDMDYYLLRHGPTDVAIYVKDASLIGTYYGTLPFYVE